MTGLRRPRPRADAIRLGSCLAMLIVAGGAAAQRKSGGGGAILPGGNSGKPIHIEATKLDYFDKEQKLIYTGGVVATQGDAKLKASVLTVFLAPKGSAGSSTAAGSSTSQVQRMLAAGPVTLLQRNQIGTGQSGVYDKGSDTVVLTGNVTLSQGPSVTEGDKLTYDLKSGQAVVTGHVRSMFVPDAANESAGDSDEPGSRNTRKASAASRGL